MTLHGDTDWYYVLDPNSGEMDCIFNVIVELDFKAGTTRITGTDIDGCGCSAEYNWKIGEKTAVLTTEIYRV